MRASCSLLHSYMFICSSILGVRSARPLVVRCRGGAFKDGMRASCSLFHSYMFIRSSILGVRPARLLVVRCRDGAFKGGMRASYSYFILTVYLLFCKIPMLPVFLVPLTAVSSHCGLSGPLRSSRARPGFGGIACAGSGLAMASGVPSNWISCASMPAVMIRGPDCTKYGCIQTRAD